jgi:twinkle protein
MEGCFMSNERPFGTAAALAFQRRGIEPETAAKLGVFTCRRESDGSAIPDEKGNIVAFPFWERGAQIACKYRGPNKTFWQDKGSACAFYNTDVLDDPVLASGHQPLIITEGEIDCLSAITCGFPLTVSVPAGAPAVSLGESPDNAPKPEKDEDEHGKFAFVWRARVQLAAVKRVVLAVDSDAPGRRLAAELVRRLGAARCCFLIYPDGCKDLNDVLTQHGPERVTAVLNAAKPYPVRGLYHLADYPPAPELETFGLGWDGWSAWVKFFAGEFVVVTGVPSHGKTAWTTQLVFQLARYHGWNIGICSPEMPTVPVFRDRLRRLFLGRKPLALEVDDCAKADGWIGAHFAFIDTDPTGMGAADEAFDLEWIIERAESAVLRDGIRVLVIDPWNEIEHARKIGENSHEYTGRSIRALKRFARVYGVTVIVVAHPTKDVVGKDGRLRTVRLYDVDGSSHWYNKADHGIVVERGQDGEATVIIEKVRQDETGRRCKMVMSYDRETGRFENVEVGLPL